MGDFRATNPQAGCPEVAALRLRGRVSSSRRPRRSTMGSTRQTIPPLSMTGIRSLQIVTPTTAGDVTWDDLARRLPHLSDFASSHWLGAWPRLTDAPRPVRVDRRRSRTAGVFRTSPRPGSQRRSKIGLRYTHRRTRNPLLRQRPPDPGRGRITWSCRTDDTARGEEITTLRRAARHGRDRVPANVGAGLARSSSRYRP